MFLCELLQYHQITYYLSKLYLCLLSIQHIFHSQADGLQSLFISGWEGCNISRSELARCHAPCPTCQPNVNVRPCSWSDALQTRLIAVSVAIVSSISPCTRTRSWRDLWQIRILPGSCDSWVKCGCRGNTVMPNLILFTLSYHPCPCFKHPYRLMSPPSYFAASENSLEYLIYVFWNAESFPSNYVYLPHSVDCHSLSAF